jgi:hypothetical protein
MNLNYKDSERERERELIWNGIIYTKKDISSSLEE